MGKMSTLIILNMILLAVLYIIILKMIIVITLERVDKGFILLQIILIIILSWLTFNCVVDWIFKRINQKFLSLIYSK